MRFSRLIAKLMFYLLVLIGALTILAVLFIELT